jgi:hypothetical protein
MSEQWWQAKVKAAGSEIVSLETLGVTNPLTDEARRIKTALRAAPQARHRKR